MTMPLTEEHMAPMFRSAFGRPYRHSTSCGSTQDQLLDSDPEGTVAVCEEQTAGRGRRGRLWAAPSGRALLASIVLKPPNERPAAQLTLLSGVVVAALIERELCVPVGIKWPNDVLVGNAKVAGILAEQRGAAVMLGIGINVNQTADELPGDARLPPTSLRVLAGRPFSRSELLAALVEELETTYRGWAERGLSVVSDELAHRDVLRGERLEVGAAAGVGAGIGSDGALLIETTSGLEAVVAGEVNVTW